MRVLETVVTLVGVSIYRKVKGTVHVFVLVQCVGMHQLTPLG